MGYSCPVCGDPQADGIHLANHLAITALTRGGDHEEYLDEHVPDWEELGEDGLAEKVVEMAEDAEYPQLFEDTTQHEHEHGHDHTHEHGGSDHEHGRASETGSPDELPFEAEIPDTEGDAAEIIQEAQELTRKRRESTRDSEKSDAAAEDGSETE